MLRAPNHESLYMHRLEQSSAAQPDQETMAAELLANTGYLSTATAVNTLLDHKDAMALAFMSQLLLNTLDPLARQIDAELDAEEEAEYDERELLRIAEAHADQMEKQAAAHSPAPQKTSAPPQPARYKAPPSHPVMSEPPREYADVRT